MSKSLGRTHKMMAKQKNKTKTTLLLRLIAVGMCRRRRVNEIMNIFPFEFWDLRMQNLCCR